MSSTFAKAYSLLIFHFLAYFAVLIVVLGHMLFSWILYTPLGTKGWSAAALLDSYCRSPPNFMGPGSLLFISMSSQLVMLQVSFSLPQFLAQKDILR